MNRKQYVLTVALSMIAGMAGGVLASQLFMGTLLFPWKTPLQVEAIRAESVYVVDKSGKPRATLSLFEGEPGLVLYDQNGETRAVLGLREGEPGLGLIDQDGKIRAVISVLEGKPGLGLIDQNGETIWEAP